MGELGKEICLACLIFAMIGASVEGIRGAIVGALVGAAIGWKSSKDTIRKRARTREALDNSAAEARRDELRLVTNYLHASGIPAWREAARELSDLSHRNDDSGPA
jgi:hypothetical protein